MQIQKNIKYYRCLKNWTQEDLSSMLCVTRQTISKWEQGINEPDIATLKKLSELFEISLDELIGEAPKAPKHRFFNAARIGWLVSISLCIFVSLILFSFVYYLKDTIPMHYNWAGEVDRYGSKWEWLFMLGYFIFILGTDLLCCKLLQKETSSKASKTKYNHLGLWITKVCCWCSQIIGLGIFLGFTVKYLKKDIWFPITNIILYSFIFCVMMFLHPSIIKRNSFFGFRTALTCSNEVAWNKMSRFSCYVLCINSLVAIILQLFVNQFWYNFLISQSILIGLAIIFGYHFYVQAKLK